MIVFKIKSTNRERKGRNPTVRLNRQTTLRSKGRTLVQGSMVKTGFCKGPGRGTDSKVWKPNTVNSCKVDWNCWKTIRRVWRRAWGTGTVPTFVPTVVKQRSRRRLKPCGQKKKINISNYPLVVDVCLFSRS